ncbi:flavin-containing monooxygenase [Aspergillus stella-maris]|uniref:flavin-containing monooxygenase n=1 Tax=Aspergillus stella-maris TaxID=1810926 RepID=UPI003CCCF3BD
MGSIQENSTFHCDAIIVGAGFSGLYGLHKLRSLGLKVNVFEAGGDIGGVWYWNRYPGARVDSEWPYYQLSLPEVWKDFQFAERFPSSEEIRRYLAHVDRRLDLRKDIQFNARVNSAIWDQVTSRWTVTTEAGHIGTAKYLCQFTGLLHRQHWPEFQGLEKYKGKVYHSAAWPTDVDVTGKRVAVIGAGATSVQIVQELSKKAGRLSMFMRRPSLCLPMGNGPLTQMEQDKLKPYFKVLFDAGRKSASGFPLTPPKQRISDLSDAERNEYYEMLWKSSAFHFALGNFTEVLLDEKASRTAYDFWAQKTRARFKNPVKRDLMAPVEPPYAIFTRRSPLEADFYECLDQDNIEIVPLLQTPFESFVENGIRTMDGEHREFDYVVFATGFESFTGSVATMNIKSKDGVDLKNIWSKGIRTYLGMLISGFPNCFLSYSPHAPTALSNGPTILECQVDFIVDAIAKMENEGLQTIEPTTEAEDKWRAAMDQTAKHTLFANTDSWWTRANIPGKKKEIVTYIRGIGNYETECREALDDWKGFVVKKDPRLGTQGRIFSQV